MIKPITIPRGIANIFMLGLSDATTVTEIYAFRPDRINSSMRDEIINNHMSNTSPISCEKKKEYKVVDNMFKTYFGGI